MSGKRSRRWPNIVIAVLAGLAAPILAVATNIVTSTDVPAVFKPLRGWAWPAFGLLSALLLLLGVVQATGRKKVRESAGERTTRVTSKASQLTNASQFLGNNVGGDVITNSGPTVYIGQSAVTISGGMGHAETAQPTARPPVPSMLPPDIVDFVGRDSELDELETTINASFSNPSTAVTVLQVTGQPGSGKSALAVHLAHTLYGQFPDGQFYVDLRGADREPLSPLAVLDVFLYAAGIPAEKVPGDLPGRQALYRTWLTGKRVLVVLDNAVDTAQVVPLLPNRPPAVVVVTSRQPMPTLPSEKPLILRTLDPSSAVDLLWTVARRECEESERPWAELVAERCGYLPLALRIAGATLLVRRYWSTQKLADSLSDEHTRLRQLSAHGLGQGALDVQASVDLSYSTLDPDLARSFRLLGAISATHFSTDLAATTLGMPSTSASVHLDRLVDAQILEPYLGNDRYRFHDLIRLFARERLEDATAAEERAGAHERALAWYTVLGERTYEILHPARPISPAAPSDQNAQAAALAHMDMERLNLYPVVAGAMNAGMLEEVSRLAFALGGYFRMRSAWDEWHRIGELGLDAARRSGSDSGEAHALLSLGSLRELTNELDLGNECCQQSLALSRQLGDAPTQFDCLRVLGIIAVKQDRLDDAIEYFEQGLRISRELDYGWGVGASLHHLGRTYRRQGKLDQAIAFSRESLEVSRGLGNRWGEATNLNTLGHSLNDKGELPEAIDCFKLGRDIYLELGDRWGVATSSQSLGLALRDLGEQDLAATCLRESVLIFQELGASAEAERVLQSLSEMSRKAT
jgi:tetratricopeptide (TPR) repeat protein